MKETSVLKSKPAVSSPELIPKSLPVCLHPAGYDFHQVAETET